MIYEDPILQILADLRIVYNASIGEIQELRKLLNQQNNDMIQMKDEMSKIKIDNINLRSQIMSMTEDVMQNTEVAYGVRN